MSTLDKNRKYQTITLSDDLLTMYGYNNTSNYKYAVFGTKSVDSGKKYFEVKLNSINKQYMYIGVADASASTSFSEIDDELYQYYESSTGKVNGVAYGAIYDSNDTIGVLVDFINKTISFRKNNVSQNSIPITPIGSLFPCFIVQPTISTNIYANCTINFGATHFKYDIPDGYSAWDIDVRIESKNQSSTGGT